MTEEDFIREYANGAIQHMLATYSMYAWRPMDVVPPARQMLIGAVEEGLALMTLTDMGDWRTSTGQPHKAPRAWMPAPVPPPRR
jgi:hypothetical protein